MTSPGSGTKRRAIILDGGRIEADDAALTPGIAQAIRSANESGFQTLLLMRAASAPDDPWNEAHDRLREMLANEGARLDGIYDRRSRFLERARDEMGIDLRASYLIGAADREAEEAGVTRVPEDMASDLGRAVAWILDRERAS